MDSRRLDLRRWSSRKTLFVGFVTFALFVASYLVEIRIIIVNPPYGDVTRGVQLVWRGLLGMATIGSFLFGIRNLAREGRRPDGQATRVEIRGTGHEIHVYPDGPDRDESTAAVGESETASEMDETAPNTERADEKRDENG